GGKSPVIVAEDADLETAANRIAWGKLLNAGQTCIAPDYVLVTEPNRDRLIDLIVDAWGRFYGPNPQKSADLGRIVSDRHLQRLVGLLTDQTVAHGGDHDAASRYMAPTIVVDPDLQSPLMTEEIFGPILPVVTVDSVDDAIRFVNGRPKPLALYPFSKDDDTIEEILRRTSSGGVCVNHTLFHFSPHELPFGGVGSSGMGRYHGQSGFDGFSNPKGVLRKPTKVETSLIYPPYGKFKTRLLRRLT
ncbi:MAG: aldehyde dehydrogenase family protein, partial [Acidimicrobiales bacterium]